MREKESDLVTLGRNRAQPAGLKFDSPKLEHCPIFLSIPSFIRILNYVVLVASSQPNYCRRQLDSGLKTTFHF